MKGEPARLREIALEVDDKLREDARFEDLKLARALVRDGAKIGGQIIRFEPLQAGIERLFDEAS